MSCVFEFFLWCGIKFCGFPAFYFCVLFSFFLLCGYVGEISNGFIFFFFQVSYALQKETMELYFGQVGFDCGESKLESFEDCDLHRFGREDEIKKNQLFGPGRVSFLACFEENYFLCLSLCLFVFLVNCCVESYGLFCDFRVCFFK